MPFRSGKHVIIGAPKSRKSKQPRHGYTELVAAMMAAGQSRNKIRDDSYYKARKNMVSSVAKFKKLTPAQRRRSDVRGFDDGTNVNRMKLAIQRVMESH